MGCEPNLSIELCGLNERLDRIAEALEEMNRTFLQFGVTHPLDLTDGLVARYAFDDDATDAVGSSDLTEINSPTYDTGKLNNAIVLNGTNQSLSSSAIAPTSSFSIALWFKPATSSGHTFFDVYCGGNLNARTFQYFPPTGVLYFSIRRDNDVQTLTTATSLTLTNGVWYHLAATYQDGAEYALNLYLNGVHVGTEGTGSSGTALQTPTTDSYIGRNAFFDYSGQRLAGSIDEYLIYNKALTAEHVAALYNDGTPPDLS